MEKMGSFLKKLEKLPVSDHCPLIKNPKWNCGKLDKGNEPFCKNVSGYTNCQKFIKWFYFGVQKAVAKEITKLEIKQKKKNQKEK